MGSTSDIEEIDMVTRKESPKQAPNGVHLSFEAIFKVVFGIFEIFLFNFGIFLTEKRISG